MRYADGKYRQKSYYVYMHKCPNSKVYIGITCQQPECRWNDGKGYERQKLFYRAIQKYGWENIEHIVLESDLTFDEASSLEKELISKYRSNDPEFGYNLTDGGEGTSGYHLTPEQLERHRQNSIGRKHSEATKAKISRLNKGRKLNLTDEQRANLAERAKNLHETNRGRVKSESECAHISEGLRRARSEGKKFGHNSPHSEETKHKISSSLKGRKKTPEEIQKLSLATSKYWEEKKRTKRTRKLF